MKRKLDYNCISSFRFLRVKWILIGGLILLLSSNHELYAQTITVQGVVSTNNVPLANVSVIVQGTQSGVYTDNDGGYKIQASKNATMVFSSVGYQTQRYS